MIDDAALSQWFRTEVLPHERALTSFIRRNWRNAADLIDLRQDIYERLLLGARAGLPTNPRAYMFTTARNHLINCAKRARIVSIELVAELDDIELPQDLFETERHVTVRDELRRALAAVENLPPRCRDVIRARKINGMSTRETAELLGVSTDTVEKQMTYGMRAIADFVLGGTGRIVRARPGRSSQKYRRS